MKRSRLLSQDFSITDALFNTRGSQTTRSFKRNSQICGDIGTPLNNSITLESDLFKSVTYKKIGSIDTNDSETVRTMETEEMNSIIENSIQCQKIRMKLEKSNKQELQIKRIDPNRHIWSEEEIDKPIKRVMTLRHLSEIQGKKERLNVLKLSIILSPKHQ